MAPSSSRPQRRDGGDHRQLQLRCLGVTGDVYQPLPGAGYASKAQYGRRQQREVVISAAWPINPAKDLSLIGNDLMKFELSGRCWPISPSRPPVPRTIRPDRAAVMGGGFAACRRCRRRRHRRRAHRSHAAQGGRGAGVRRAGGAAHRGRSSGIARLDGGTGRTRRSRDRRRPLPFTPPGRLGGRTRSRRAVRL